MQQLYRQVGPDGRLLIIEGEPGIGKTRLAAALLDAAAANGAPILTARGYAGETNLAYAPALQEGLARVDAGLSYPPDLLVRLYAETEGLSFFVVEYLHALKTHDGELGAGALPPTPASVRDLLHHRLRQIGETERQIVQTALAIGHSFDLGLVQAVSGRSAEETVTALALCQRLGDRHHEAALRSNLADALHQMGDAAAAQAQIRQSVTIYAEIGREEETWRAEIWQLTAW